jgi:F-type H+-transporting ATPase subunit b
VISINIYEIVMQMVNFLILLFLMNKFMIKPLSEFLENRADSIKEDIQKAESSKEDARKALLDQKELFKQAREEAKGIRVQAEEATRIEKDALLATAKTDAKRLLQEAKKELEQDVSNARKALLSETANLAIKLSEQILKRELNVKDKELLVSESLGQLQKV